MFYYLIMSCRRAPNVPPRSPASGSQDFCNMFSTFKTASNPLTKNKALIALVGNGVDKRRNVAYAFPPTSNTKSYIPFDQKDTPDWDFTNDSDGLPTQITCRNPGNWTIINQYQLDCVKSSTNGPQQLSGFSVFGNEISGVEGDPVPNSSATNTVETKGDKNVLVIAFSAYFNYGDYFKVGVVSSDSTVAICNSYPGVTNLVDPICITLATKQ